MPCKALIYTGKMLLAPRRLERNLHPGGYRHGLHRAPCGRRHPTRAEGIPLVVKIALTGAGSLEFTRKLLHDILTVPELRDTHFAFHDISAENLEKVTRRCRQDIEANGLPATISATTDRREAF